MKRIYCNNLRGMWAFKHTWHKSFHSGGPRRMHWLHSHVQRNNRKFGYENMIDFLELMDWFIFCEEKFEDIEGAT